MFYASRDQYGWAHRGLIGHFYLFLNLERYEFCDLLISFIQPQAREKAKLEGFEVSVAKTSFKANTKALAENEGEGIAKVSFNFLFSL
jgi:hypothetical protein